MAFRRKRQDLIFVGIQILLIIVYVIIPAFISLDPNQTLRVVGIFMVVTGACIFLAGLFKLRKNLTPFPSVRHGGHLVTSGIYHFIRHPLYTGITLGLSGFGMYRGHAGKLGIVVLLVILFYFKSSYEERMLLEAYPDYERYSRRAGRFLPRWKNVIDALILRDKYH